MLPFGIPWYIVPVVLFILGFMLLQVQGGRWSIVSWLLSFVMVAAGVLTRFH